MAPDVPESGAVQIAKDPARDPELRSVHADVLVPRCQKVRPRQYPFRVVIQERNIEPLLARVRESVNAAGWFRSVMPSRGMGGPITVADQVDRLVWASEAAPDRGFMARMMALLRSLPRTNPRDRLRYVRRNGPYTLVMKRGRPKAPKKTGRRNPSPRQRVAR